MSAGNQPVISKFGNVFVEWLDATYLSEVLARLRAERQSCGQPHKHVTGSARLVGQAERIKDNATLYLETDEML